MSGTGDEMLWVGLAAGLAGAALVLLAFMRGAEHRRTAFTFAAFVLEVVALIAFTRLW